MKKLITILTFFPFLCFGQWNQLGADINLGSGVSQVAMNANGETVVAGAGLFNNNDGQVQIHEWDGISWSQKGADINGPNTGHRFGFSVDITPDGNTVVIGAPQVDPGFTAVYEWNGNSWIQKGTDIIGEASLFNFAGGSVSISADGNIIAIGANGNSNNNASFSGHARVYEWDGITWVQLGADIDGLNQFDAFGDAVSLNSSGNIVAVGALGAGPGETTVFEWDGANWIQLGATIMATGTTNNNFGDRVDLDNLGTTVAVSATHNDITNGAGYVEVFSWDGTNWNQDGTRLESDPNSADFFDNAKLSADGNMVVVGAWGNEGNAPGFVSVFDFDGVNWNLINNVITGSAPSVRFGETVDISDDGSKIISRENGGIVRVFENACPTTRNISGDVLTGLYRATDSIISDGSVGLGSSNGNVEYKAGNTIELLSDFHAEANVIFEAIIGGCP